MILLSYTTWCDGSNYTTALLGSGLVKVLSFLFIKNTNSVAWSYNKVLWERRILLKPCDGLDNEYPWK